MTITASSNLSEDEINKAVHEAEQFASEDKKRKDEVETRNHADSLVYTTEKSLKEMGDKISAEDKAKIEAEIAKVKAAVEKNDAAEIKTATDKLTEVSYEVFGRVYQQEAQAQQNAGGAGFDPNAASGANYDANASQAPQDDTVVDAEYEVVDNDKK